MNYYHLAIGIVFFAIVFSGLSAQNQQYPFIYVCNKNNPYCILFKPFNQTNTRPKLEQRSPNVLENQK